MPEANTFENIKLVNANNEKGHKAQPKQGKEYNGKFQ